MVVLRLYYGSTLEMRTQDSSPQRMAVMNRKLAKTRWGTRMTKGNLALLDELSRQFQFSIAMGDVVLLDGRWYVTHTGLLRLARKNRCAGIQARPILEFSDAPSRRWAFEATVFKSQMCLGFVGHGDADPSNVSAIVQGAEMRVAETRAVNRALRKAYGIGICSVDEVGSLPESQVSQESKRLPPRP